MTTLLIILGLLFIVYYAGIFLLAAINLLIWIFKNLASYAIRKSSEKCTSADIKEKKSSAAQKLSPQQELQLMRKNTPALFACETLSHILITAYSISYLHEIQEQYPLYAIAIGGILSILLFMTVIHAFFSWYYWQYAAKSTKSL